MLMFLGWLALNIDELRGMRHRLEHDDELRRQLQRQHRLFMRWPFDCIQHYVVGQRRERFPVEIDAGTPEDLLEIFPERQRVGIMRRDPPDPGTDREGNLDLLVDRGLIAAGAYSASVI